MNPTTEKVRVTSCEFWDWSLLDQVHKIVFPWSTDERLNGNDVGRAFFLDSNASQLWDESTIKNALKSLADIGIEKIDLELFIDSTVPPSLSNWEHLMGAVLILDRGPRYLCKGTDARYIYHLFDALSRCLIRHLVDVHPEWLTLTGWLVTGLSTDQIVLRVLMLLAPLAHSEESNDQRIRAELTE